MAGVQEGLLGSQIWNELAKELRATSRYRVRFRNAFAKLTRELRKFLNLPAGGTEKKKPLWYWKSSQNSACSQIFHHTGLAILYQGKIFTDYYICTHRVSWRRRWCGFQSRRSFHWGRVPSTRPGWSAPGTCTWAAPSRRCASSGHASWLPDATRRSILSCASPRRTPSARRGSASHWTWRRYKSRRCVSPPSRFPTTQFRFRAPRENSGSSWFPNLTQKFPPKNLQFLYSVNYPNIILTLSVHRRETAPAGVTVFPQPRGCLCRFRHCRWIPYFSDGLIISSSCPVTTRHDFLPDLSSGINL